MPTITRIRYRSDRCNIKIRFKLKLLQRKFKGKLYDYVYTMNEFKGTMLFVEFRYNVVRLSETCFLQNVMAFIQ